MGRGAGSLLMRYSQTGEMTWAWPALKNATSTAVRRKCERRLADGGDHGNRSLCSVVLISVNRLPGRSQADTTAPLEPQLILRPDSLMTQSAEDKGWMASGLYQAQIQPFK